MGTAGKVFIGLIVAIIAVVAVVFVLVLQNLDTIIKQVIEDVGTQVTGTPVRVSEVKFTLQEGRGEIYGLTVANLPGYQAKNLFEMDKVAVQLEPASLTGPVIVINEVLIDGTRLTAEQKGTKTNVNELMDRLKAGEEEPPPAETGEAADVRLMLESFAFVNSAGTIKTQQLGEKSLKIPDVRMSNLGDRQTGLTPQELTNAVLSSVMKQVQQAVTKYLKNLATDAAKEELNKQLDEKIGAENREKLEGLKGLLKKN